LSIPRRLVDHHTHIAGIGAGARNNFVNPRMLAWRYPLHHLKLKIYLSASGVDDVGQADAQAGWTVSPGWSGISKSHGRHRLLPRLIKITIGTGRSISPKLEFYVP